MLDRFVSYAKMSVVNTHPGRFFSPEKKINERKVIHSCRGVSLVRRRSRLEAKCAMPIEHHNSAVSIKGLFVTLVLSTLCHYAKCRVLFIVMLSIVLLIVMAPAI